MNTLLRTTVFSLIAVTSPLQAVHYHAYYEQTQPTHIHHCADCPNTHPYNDTPSTTSSGYHGYMVTLAQNPALGFNDSLARQVIEYTNHCWHSEKKEIFSALANNSSLSSHDELVYAFIRYVNSCWSSEKHGFIKALARNSQSGLHEDLVTLCINYINQCWSSEKREILLIFASNPSTCHNYTLTSMMQKEMIKQKEQQKRDALITIGVGIGFMTAALIKWCIEDQPKTSYHYGS